MATHGLQFLVQASQFVVHQIQIVGEGPELIPVANGDVPGEIARGDLTKAALDLPDGSHNGPRQDISEQQGQDGGHRRNGDE